MAWSRAYYILDYSCALQLLYVNVRVYMQCAILCDAMQCSAAAAFPFFPQAQCRKQSKAANANANYIHNNSMDINSNLIV